MAGTVFFSGRCSAGYGTALPYPALTREIAPS
jgi:hypothetical protein